MVTCSKPTCRRSKDLRGGLCPPCFSEEHGGEEEGMSDPSLASYPPAFMAAAPPINMDLVNSVAERVFGGGEPVSDSDFQKAMFGMMYNNMTKTNKLDMKLEKTVNNVKENEQRIKALEDKAGGQKDCAIPLSIVIQNLPLNPNGEADMVSVIAVIQEINPEGVNAETDVVKVERKGYKPAVENKTEKLGVVLVELRNTEVKAKIMKTKKVLANHHFANLRSLRINNMKTVDQINQERFNREVLRLVPGGDQFYLTGSGAIRPQTRPWVPRHQGPRAPGFQQGPRGPGPQQGHPRFQQGPPRFQQGPQGFQQGPQGFQHGPPNHQQAPNPHPQPTNLHQAPLFQPLTQPSSQATLAPIPGAHPPAPGVFSQRPPVFPSTSQEGPLFTFSQRH